MCGADKGKNLNLTTLCMDFLTTDVTVMSRY